MSLYKYPSATADYRLIPAGKFYTSRRNGPILGIVLHITAGLQDQGMVGTDGSAEGTAKWAVDRRPDVSWHVGVDSDSIVPCIPAGYVAWHAKGYNSRTFGIEISKLDVDWSDAPKAWVEATLRNAARALAPVVKQYDLPLALRTKAQVDAAIAAGKPFGFTYHSFTSAGTRSDPGKNFPINRLLELIKAELAGTNITEEDDLSAQDVQEIKDHINAVAIDEFKWGDETRAGLWRVSVENQRRINRIEALVNALAEKQLTADEVADALRGVVEDNYVVQGDVRLTPKPATEVTA